MAFNWQTFRTRTLTAAIFVLVMLTGLLWNHWSFLLLFSIIHFGCWWEYLRLMERIHTTSLHIYSKLGFMLLGYGLMFWFCSPMYQIAGYGIKENFSLPVSVAGFILLITGVFQKMPVNLKTFSSTALGFLYISLSWGLMISFYGKEDFYVHDTTYVLWKYTFPVVIIVSIWVNDTMAYIVGSLIGKTPISKISPKKTWEGTVGGIILCIGAIGFLLPLTIFSIFDLLISIVFSTIAGIAAISGTFGDLLESKLKRMADVKDSGHIMPGHGGFLDRFDSLLIATPFVWLYVNLIMN